MNILGIVTSSHDTGIALLSDGVPAFILEEERFNRQKHTQHFPSLSLSAGLNGSGIAINDIDVITTPWVSQRLRRTFFKGATDRLPASLNILRPGANTLQGNGIFILPYLLSSGLRKHLKATKLPRIVEVGHHDSHAAIFFVSPFEDATVLIMDGYGDDTSTSVYTGRGNRLKQHWQTSFFDSLGMLYTCTTLYLGFRPFEEGSVMALAACGGPTYAAKFRELIRLDPDGRYTVNRDFISYDCYGMMRPFRQKFYDSFGPPRKSHEPLTDRHRDLAFALQTTIEDAILHVVHELSRTYRSRNLCLGGGVALNCVANARIVRETEYERVWVSPCASDTGVPFGSTLWHYHQTLGQPRRFELTHPFYGSGYSDIEITNELNNAGLQYQRKSESDLLAQVAKDLADSKIVGWFQGRFEMGPRALGNRSILSDARNAATKDLINSRVKHREPFRPFAPAVLVERMSEFFEIDQPDPFMTIAPKIRADKAHLIPAAAHVDGTGRVQSVDRAANPRLYGVIEEYAKLTGVPVILNTSFNRQEPIVARPEEAISCFLRTDMDVLVLGDFYVTDRNAAAISRAHDAFISGGSAADRWTQAQSRGQV
jgi:carbamoyltransferase